VIHHTPTIKKSTAPRAGSHIGVFGSGSWAGSSWASWASFTAPKTLLKGPGVNTAQRAMLRHKMIRVPPFRLPLLLVPALAALASSALAAPPAAPKPLPALPGLPGNDPLNAPGVSVSPAPGAAGAGAAAPGAPVAATQGQTDARKGVVTIERDGKLIGVGTVLLGDGRILTALSALGASEQADVRYVDGHTVKAKIGHRDRAWDLALLVPLTGKWADGLRASEADPGGQELKVFVASAPGKPNAVGARLKSKVDAQAREGGTLASALEIELKGGSPSSGAPIIDGTGSVVGGPPAPAAGGLVLGATSAPAPICAPAFYGAPVSSIRSFLLRTPSTAVAPSPWLGIVGNPDQAGNTRGVRVMAIAPQSPAEKGGLKTNADRNLAHLIVAVDGRPVDTPEKLAELIGKHGIGETVKLLVLDGEKLRELAIVLRAPP
jgi:serine protease Do